MVIHESFLGLYILTARDIISMLSQREEKDEILKVSFYEIYQGHLYDLLNERKKLFAREDGRQQVIIAGLEEVQVTSVEHLMDIIQTGNMQRSTGNERKKQICLDS
jgi:hypothetical protein